MGRLTRSFALLVGLALILPLPQVVEHPATAVAQTSTAPATTSDPQPLPGGCGGTLPPNSPQVCCVSGYVFLDGTPIAGAKVTLTNLNASPSHSVVVVTENGPDSRFPYYRVNVNQDLNVQPNEQISIRVEYEGRVREMQHTTLTGGQQVDVVLPRANLIEDYTFQETIGLQGADGQLRTPMGVAVDRTGSIYVADSATSRIQVFNSSGLFLRQWGTRGAKPGQFGEIWGIALDSEGAVYVAHGRITKFSSTGTLLEEWGARPDYGPEGVFDNARAVAVDRTDTVYSVGDSGNGG